MLTPDEVREIEELLVHYPTRRGGAIDALVALQRRRRWIADDSLADLAALLGMTTHELDSIATFYNLVYRRPVGRHVILLCDSVSCWIMGCDRIRRELEERLRIREGETTEDGRFTLLPIACLGTCDRAPALMVDEDTHRDLTPETLGALLGRYE